MKYRLACADFTFPLMSHDQSLGLISMLGFKGVDIGLFEGRSHLWPSREFKNVDRSARSLKKKLDDSGLKAADIFLQTAPDFVPFAVNHPLARRRAKAREWFLDTLDYAAGTGSRHVTILPGVNFSEEKNSESFARAVDELSWRVEEARKHRIVLGIEAHVGSLAPRPKSAEKLVRSVSGLTLTLDYTHFTRAGLPDSESEPLVPFASHFHARGARRGRLQESFEKNTIDYKRVLKTMEKSNYRGWIGIEYVWIDWEHCNECDNVSETIQFRNFFISSMK
jgi:sugar phosphate isomerase/epimerase